jgi:hypothetical protein
MVRHVHDVWMVQLGSHLILAVSFVEMSLISDIDLLKQHSLMWIFLGLKKFAFSESIMFVEGLQRGVLLEQLGQFCAVLTVRLAHNSKIKY